MNFGEKTSSRPIGYWRIKLLTTSREVIFDRENLTYNAPWLADEGSTRVTSFDDNIVAFDLCKDGQCASAKVNRRDGSIAYHYEHATERATFQTDIYGACAPAPANAF